MNNLIRKLGSRKLWLAIAGITYGIAMGLGVDATEITTVGGGVVVVLCALGYIVTEGRIDAEGVKSAIEAGQIIYDTIVDEDEPVIGFDIGGDE